VDGGSRQHVGASQWRRRRAYEVLLSAALEGVVWGGEVGGLGLCLI
jgi:hypothetical protein